MWAALPAEARHYIYRNDLPLHVAHIDAEYDLPEKEVRVAGIARRDEDTLFVNSAKDGRDWELPGGRLETGETPEDAIKREFTEETGCQVRHVEPVLAMLWVFPASTIVQIVFSVEHGEKVRDPVDEVRETDWFNELPGNISFGDDGYETYEFIVNSESVEVQVSNGRLQGFLETCPSKKSLTVAGVAGGAAITVGLARRLVSTREESE